MAKSREINMNLPSADDLFTTQEERNQKNQEYVKDISIYEITDFPNHPFKVKMDDKMVETIESVREHGVLVPALVRFLLCNSRRKVLFQSVLRDFPLFYLIWLLF